MSGPLLSSGGSQVSGGLVGWLQPTKVEYTNKAMMLIKHINLFIYKDYPILCFYVLPLVRSASEYVALFVTSGKYSKAFTPRQHRRFCDF